MVHRAKKVVIITERLVLDGVLEIIQAEGATGYTIVAAGGRGSRSVRPKARSRVVDEFENVQVDVIGSDEMVTQIAERVAEKYFEDYSGIVYIQDVEILRSHKFLLEE